MATPDQELKYKVTTTADTSGAEKQVAAIKEITKATEEANEAGGENNETNAEAQAALDKITEGEKAAADAAKRGAKAKEEAAAAARALKNEAQRGAGALNDLRGAANGSAGAMLKLGDAAKNAFAAFKANPLGLILTALIAALPAIKNGLNAVVESFDDAFRRMQERERTAGDALKKGLEEVAAANAKAMEKIAADAAQARSEYELLNRQMDEARKRVDALAAAELARDLAKIDLAESTALATATTPQQREQISRNAGRQREDRRALETSTQIENEATAARLKIASANAALAKITADLAPLESEAALARSRANDAVEFARASLNERGYDDEIAREDQRRATLLKAEADAAEERLAIAREQRAADFATVDANKRAAEAAIELASIREQTLNIERTALAARRITEQGGVAPTAPRSNQGGTLSRAGEDPVIVAAETQRALDGVAAEVRSLGAPPPLNVGPIREGLIEFQGRTIRVQQTVQTQLDALAAAVRQNNAALSNLTANRGQ